MNNKTFQGYIDVFSYIHYYIEEINTSKLKYDFLCFTTDYEIALFTAFNKVFNKDNKLWHYGC